jgi:DNA mismatch repair protein MutS2
MPAKSAEALEFPALVDLLKRYLVSPLGEWQHAEFAASPFFSSRESAETALAETAEAMDWLRSCENSPSRGGLTAPRFQGLRDMRAAASQLRAEGSVLETSQILGLLELLDRAEQIRTQLSAQETQFPRLAGYAERFADLRMLLRGLSGKIRADGELDDHASPTLARIRRQISQHRQSVQKSLDKFVHDHYQEGVLQDDYVTIRNGRLVVPVKAGWKWRVEGVIHSASGTGQTVFIEPLETIVLNNRLVRLLEDEQREAHRILREMTSHLRGEVEAIQQAIGTLAELEWLFAKANFGREFRCAIPAFSPPGSGGPERLRLDWARHPLLEDVLRKDGRKIVPLSLTLEGSERVLVVSGPNAGGKTIVLKTTGLLVLMAQAALPVPAEQAEFPWFERVLADIGDSQSITESLSTFSAHIEKLKAMMADADARSLVLLDELGAATDPQEGGALAVAVVDHFLQRGAFHIASTHLPALKIYAANASGVRNAAVGFDPEGLSPTFRLLVGLPGQSAGLAMAQRFGMPAEVIERARATMATQEGDAAAFLNEMHRRVEEYEQAQKSLRQAEHELRQRERALGREWEKRETAKLAELERRVEALIEQFGSQAKDALEKIGEASDSRRALQNAQHRVAKTQREMREQFESAADEALGRHAEPKPAAAAAAALTPGARVQLAKLAATGEVLRALSDEQYEVQVGRLKMRVSRQDITQVLPFSQPAAKIGPLPARVTLHTAPRAHSSLSEINVIGKNREEAEDAVDKFLDEAVLAEVNRVRVIHGHGMNVLRKALWQMFASHIHVARYYQAEQHEGGAGATIVEVKE